MRRSDPRSLRIALMGTRGVPAHYGGFETCVEEVGQRLVDRGHRVVVYCRETAAGTSRPTRYLGMRLVYLPAASRRSLETLSHTGLSALHLFSHGADVAVMFNAANAVWLPILRLAGIPVATNVDGLEWQRAKWGGIGKRYYRAAEAASVRWSDALIADAQVVADYYRDEFRAGTDLLAYGAPVIAPGSDRLADLGLEPNRYHLVVARFEPENHVHLMVEGYRASGARLPLVVVGSAPYSDSYTALVHSLAGERVHFLGGVWDQDLLDQLYAHCYSYLHGHSVGGTNPSLLRAIGAGAATIAFDVGFNREVLGPAGRYFRTAQELVSLLDEVERDPDGVAARGAAAQCRARDYDWDEIASGYEALCLRLSSQPRPRRPSGRRSGQR